MGQRNIINLTRNTTITMRILDIMPGRSLHYTPRRQPKARSIRRLAISGWLFHGLENQHALGECSLWIVRPAAPPPRSLRRHRSVGRTVISPSSRSNSVFGVEAHLTSSERGASRSSDQLLGCFQWHQRASRFARCLTW